MKECARVRGSLSKFVDAELGDRDSAAVKAHLEACLGCKEEFAKLSALKNIITGKERKALPEDYLIHQLRQRIYAQNEPSPKLQWLVDMGNLSRKLIPVPVAVLILSAVFLTATLKEYEKINYIDCYLFQDSLTNEEANVLNQSQITLEGAAKVVLGTNGT